jgi:transmembrane sensor
MNEQYIEALVQKYAEGTATNEEVQQLMDWYHAASVEEVAWPTAHAKEKDDVYHRMLQHLQNSLPVKRGYLYWLTPLRAAAVLVIILGAATLFYLWPASPLTYSSFTNSSGQIRHMQLPDGSMVWLNAATTLRYANAFKQKRQLQLDGEAYFEVKHDPEHPFIVESGGLHIRVLGTRFNIRSYSDADRTIVSLLQGKVSISAAEKELAVLEPGSQMEWDRSFKKAITNPIDTTVVVAWKKGQLQFQGQPLLEIVQTLERWYGVRFQFANSGLAQCRYYMSFDNTTSLRDLLALLTEITRMDFVVDKHSIVDKQTIIISGTGCQ